MRAPIILSTIILIFVLIGIGRHFSHTSSPYLDERSSLEEVSSPFIGDDLETVSLLRGVENSIRYYSRSSIRKALQFGTRQVTAEEYLQSLEALRSLVKKYGVSPTLFEEIRRTFEFFSPPISKILVTGYYESTLRCSRQRGGTYQFPLYRPPRDLITVPLQGRTKEMRKSSSGTLVPYYSREEIDYGGVLQGKGLELLWVDDPLEVFFLHIQGSGVCLLPTGEEIRVGYAAKNGLPYEPIGKLFIKEGIFTAQEVSMQRMRAYLTEHPDQIKKFFVYNPSYVFFREVKEGPLGNIGVPLTAQRSIATDSALFPKGAVGLLQSEEPVFDDLGSVKEWRPFIRFVVNQDTGGAIRGVAHIDLFMGRGPRSEAVAGVLRQPGLLWFMLKKKEVAEEQL